MPLNLRERQVQAAARRIGLKLIRLKAIVDRYHADETGRKRYYLRPIWDARHVVRVLPSGGYELATSTRGRRGVATALALDDMELLLSRWIGERAGGDRHPQGLGSAGAIGTSPRVPGCGAPRELASAKRFRTPSAG
jgi:hypothetical protein